jgi:hypothetical protein
MGIVEAGADEAAPEINDIGVGTEEFEHLIIVAHTSKVIILQRECRGTLRVVQAGPDVSVDKDPISKWFVSPQHGAEDDRGADNGKPACIPYECVHGGSDSTEI